MHLKNILSPSITLFLLLTITTGWSQSFFPDDATPICADTYVSLPAPEPSEIELYSSCLPQPPPLTPPVVIPGFENPFSPYLEFYRVEIEEGSVFEFQIILEEEVNYDFIAFLNPNWDDLMSTPLRDLRPSQNLPFWDENYDLGLSANALAKCGAYNIQQASDGILRAFDVEPGDEVLIVVDRLQPINVNYSIQIGGDVILDCSILGEDYFKCIAQDENFGVFYEDDILPDLIEEFPDHTFKFFTHKENARNDIGPEMSFPLEIQYQNDYDKTDIYVRVEDENGFLIKIVDIHFYLGKYPELAIDNIDLGAVCDNGYGIGRENLTRFNQNFYEGDDSNVKVKYYADLEDYENNIPIENPENYALDGDAQIVADLVNQFTGCRSVEYATVEIELEPSPRFDLSEYNYVAICSDPSAMSADGQMSVYVESGVPEEGYLFKWEYQGYVPMPEDGPNIEIDEEGKYKLTVKNDFGIGCEWSEDFTVKRHEPPVFSIRQAYQPSANLNGIQIFDITSYGVYVFRVDNGEWQSPGPGGKLLFKNIKPGKHRVYAKEIFGCGEVVQYITIIGYPDFFTPNGDGINDYWNVIGLEDQSTVKISIYDRYGVPLAQLNPNDQGWDGTFQGQNMPANDYWFSVEYTEKDDDGAERPAIFKGHFTLKR